MEEWIELDSAAEGTGSRDERYRCEGMGGE